MSELIPSKKWPEEKIFTTYGSPNLLENNENFNSVYIQTHLTCGVQYHEKEQKLFHSEGCILS